jgi:hypothetical protein
VVGSQGIWILLGCVDFETECHGRKRDRHFVYAKQAFALLMTCWVDFYMGERVDT